MSTTAKATDREELDYLHLLDEFGNTIPKERRTLKIEDINWFLRKGAIMVSSHQNFDEAVLLAQKVLNKRAT